MNPINDRLRRDFEDRYEAQFVTSDRSYRRVKRATYAEVQEWYMKGMTTDPPDHQVEAVEMIEIYLPRDKVPELLESQEAHLYVKERQERMLREQYPALQSAWEQYQIVLSLVDDYTRN